MAERQRNIVIIGGGVIGSTTAYFLTRHPKFNPALQRITLLEATTVAAGASGKAGGLLALWAYPAELVPLSYRLHQQLAAEHGGAERWGYRKLSCGSLEATVTDGSLKAKLAKPQTVNGNGDAHVSHTSPPSQPALSPTDPKAEAGVQGTGKEWEKLPKQDSTAAGLLDDSVLPTDLDWIDGELVAHYQQMGRVGFTETAQVHPYFFTTSMAALAQEKGVGIHLGAKVTKINYSKTEVHSVEYLERGTNTTRTIDGITDVVVAAGPWTGVLLPRSSVEGLRAHSVVWEANVAPYAVFTNIELPKKYVPEHRQKMGQGRKHKGNVDPEIYARPNNEVYACGEPDSSIPLPPTADLVQCDKAQCDDLAAYVGTISPALAAAPVKKRQACYLPRHMRFGDERGPLIGRTVTPGLWVASGHTCWGIQNGPATGCLMAEMLLDGAAKSANIEKLDPRKYKI